MLLAIGRGVDIVNWIMIQAANTAIRYDDRIAGFCERVKARRRGRHQIAITQSQTRC